MSQFTSNDGKLCLKDIIDVPQDVYPVGRLDYDSEGLLLLTNDTKINHQLLTPQFEHLRIYWVQVEGLITAEAIDLLSKGVSINNNGIVFKTKPAFVALLEEPIIVPERNPPIRFRKNIPTSWVHIQLTEGKNRQVRKMFASVQFPVLRLIRAQIGEYTGQKNVCLRSIPCIALNSGANRNIYNSRHAARRPDNFEPRSRSRRLLSLIDC